MMSRVFAALVAAMIVGVTSLSPVAAAPYNTMAANCGEGVGSLLGLKSWDACLKKGDDGRPQITALNDVWLIVLPLLEDALKVIGYAAVAFIIWGGIKYIKSQGEPGEITQAKTIIWNAVFGFVLAMMSVGIVQLIALAIE